MQPPRVLPIVWIALGCAMSTPSPTPVPELPVLSFPVMTDWLNVRSFGAKGDGVNDDTIPIQAALNVLATTNNKT